MSNTAMRISESDKAQAWLGQLRPEHVATATRMLDHLMFVPTTQFRAWLAEEIFRQAATGRLALYGEREFHPGARFFPLLKPGKVKRAIGTKGPDLVKPTRGSAFVGSEGIIAQLLSELARRPDMRALLTPGPDRLRPMKSRGPTRRLAIVTDVIGSGNRIFRMLNAMWRTESIRSWHSHRKVPLEILIISYATSATGQTRIESHRLKPQVIARHIAPTIWDIEDDSGPFEKLCSSYEPYPPDEHAGPHGYGDAGTLIAFGHGCPNTAPPMLWRHGRRWTPLFPERSAVEFDLLERRSDVANFGDRLLGLNRPSLANPNLLARFETLSREALLLLAAVSHGLRDSVKLASRTGLEVARVDSLLSTFQTAGWISNTNAVTAQGLAELRAAGRVLPTKRDIPIDAVSVYFPTSLRG